MKTVVYSRWDGTQNEFSLDAEDAFRAVSDLMMQGMRLSDALEWMRQNGFSTEQLSFRVMGMDELLDELRTELEGLGTEYHLDESMREIEERLEDILDREQAALLARHGHESSAMNDFLGKRHGESKSLSERIERFRDHEFEDEQAREDFAALLAELDEISATERFVSENAARFKGPKAADYETAQELRRRVEELERLVSAIARGEFEGISPEDLRRLLGDDAARSFVFLRDFEQLLRDRGYVRDGKSGPELTPRGVRKIGAHALADVYGSLQKNRFGEHATTARGGDIPRADETRPYAFGDALALDVTRSLMNAVRRLSASGSPGCCSWTSRGP
jgi:uncharacterized protein with von Willebrand factor type A (vWA) domain